MDNRRHQQGLALIAARHCFIKKGALAAQLAGIINADKEGL